MSDAEYSARRKRQLMQTTEEACHNIAILNGEVAVPRMQFRDARDFMAEAWSEIELIAPESQE
jgi:hypothetical protein